MANKIKLIIMCLCTAGMLAGCQFGNFSDEKDSTEELEKQTLIIEETETETETEIHPKIENLDQLDAGTHILPEDIEGGNVDDYFRSYEIDDELFNRIYGLSYKEYCDIPLEDLRYLKVLHYGFDQQIYVGELMVDADIADKFLYIFKELYLNAYEIDKMFLVDNYGADDTWSIENNNTSAFNYRVSTLDGITLSNHAFGRAIDINPIQNPYVNVYSWGLDTYHDKSIPYMNREDTSLEHMITHDDLCYKLFIEQGFSWGGDWENPIDYQHFEWIE